MADKVTASHILLMYKGAQRSRATRSRADAQAEIAAIAEQLAAGVAFADMAKQHSDCPSARAGGDLGEFGKGQMVGAFQDVAFKLPVGATSEPVETGFGFHIIHRTA
jgi:peptidyl-prolyl cis-trans isomerase C/peptidyl-prolyl cis-trans isomerase SurA